MVIKGDICQYADLLNALRNLNIVFAGYRITSGMVVQKHNARRLCLKSMYKHFSWRYERSIDSSLGKNTFLNQVQSGVKKQQHNILYIFVPEALHVIVSYRLRIMIRQLSLCPRLCHSRTKFSNRFELDCLYLADSVNLL